jgi:predicted small lipoprotein YifL
MRRILVSPFTLAVCTVTLTACGQHGALYLPTNAAPAGQAAAAPAFPASAAPSAKTAAPIARPASQ